MKRRRADFPSNLKRITAARFKFGLGGPKQETRAQLKWWKCVCYARVRRFDMQPLALFCQGGSRGWSCAPSYCGLCVVLTNAKMLDAVKCVLIK